MSNKQKYDRFPKRKKKQTISKSKKRLSCDFFKNNILSLCPLTPVKGSVGFPETTAEDDSPSKSFLREDPSNLPAFCSTTKYDVKDNETFTLVNLSKKPCKEFSLHVSSKKKNLLGQQKPKVLDFSKVCASSELQQALINFNLMDCSIKDLPLHRETRSAEKLRCENKASYNEVSSKNSNVILSDSEIDVLDGISASSHLSDSILLKRGSSFESTVICNESYNSAFHSKLWFKNENFNTNAPSEMCFAIEKKASSYLIPHSGEANHNTKGYLPISVEKFSGNGMNYSENIDLDKISDSILIDDSSVDFPSCSPLSLPDDKKESSVANIESAVSSKSLLDYSKTNDVSTSTCSSSAPVLESPQDMEGEITAKKSNLNESVCLLMEQLNFSHDMSFQCGNSSDEKISEPNTHLISVDLKSAGLLLKLNNCSNSNDATAIPYVKNSFPDCKDIDGSVLPLDNINSPNLDSSSSDESYSSSRVKTSTIDCDSSINVVTSFSDRIICSGDPASIINIQSYNKLSLKKEKLPLSEIDSSLSSQKNIAPFIKNPALFNVGPAIVIRTPPVFHPQVYANDGIELISKPKSSIRKLNFSASSDSSEDMNCIQNPSLSFEDLVKLETWSLNSDDNSQLLSYKSNSLCLTSQQPILESQQPILESQQPILESQQPSLESQQPSLESQQPRTESQQPRIESQQPRFEIQQPILEIQQPILESQQPSLESHHLSPSSHHPSPTSHHPSPTSHHPSPTSHHPSPTTLSHHSSPTSHHPSPTSHHPSPTSHHPSPTSHHPSPTSHHPSPTSHHPSPTSHHLSPTSHHPSPTSHHPSPTSHHPSPTSHHPSPTSHHPSPTSHHPSPTSHHPSPTSHHPSPTSHHPSPTSHHPSPTSHHPSPTSHHPSPTSHHPSPTSHQASPTSHQASPTSHQASPTSHQASPTSHQASPTSHQASPTSHQASPTSHQASPTSHQASPTSHQASPTSHQASPTSHQASPTSHQASPTSHQASPTSHQASPTSHQASPTSHQASPTSHQASPTSHQASPTSHQASPTSHQASPTSHQASPTRQQASRHSSPAASRHSSPAASRHSSPAASRHSSPAASRHSSPAASRHSSPAASRHSSPAASRHSSPAASRHSSPAASRHSSPAASRHSSPAASRHSSPAASRHSSPAASRHSSPAASRHSSPAASRHSSPAASRHSSPAASRHSSPAASRHSSPAASRHSSPAASRHSSPAASRHSSPAASRHSSPAASRHSSPAASRHSSPVASRHSSPVASLHSSSYEEHSTSCNSGMISLNSSGQMSRNSVGQNLSRCNIVKAGNFIASIEGLAVDSKGLVIQMQLVDELYSGNILTSDDNGSHNNSNKLNNSYSGVPDSVKVREKDSCSTFPSVHTSCDDLFFSDDQSDKSIKTYENSLYGLPDLYLQDSTLVNEGSNELDLFIGKDSNLSHEHEESEDTTPTSDTPLISQSGNISLSKRNNFFCPRLCILSDMVNASPCEKHSSACSWEKHSDDVCLNVNDGTQFEEKLFETSCMYYRKHACASDRQFTSINSELLNNKSKPVELHAISDEDCFFEYKENSQNKMINHGLFERATIQCSNFEKESIENLPSAAHSSLINSPLHETNSIPKKWFPSTQKQLGCSALTPEAGRITLRNKPFTATLTLDDETLLETPFFASDSPYFRKNLKKHPPNMVSF